MWEGQIEALGGRWRVVAPDFPGFGKSPPPKDPDAWRIEDFADSVKELMEHLGIERAAVAGLSMGGYVALSLLRRAPSLVSALVLADTRAEGDTEEVREGRKAQQEEIRSRGIDGLPPLLVEKLLAPRRLHDPAIREKVLGMMRHPEAGYLAALEAMKWRPDSRPWLQEVRVPTLVVVGEEDILTPPSVAKSMVAAIRGSRLAVLPGAGHLSNLEEGGAFNDALISFLEDLGPSGGFS